MQIGLFVNMPMLTKEEIKEELSFYGENGIKLAGLIFESPWGPYDIDGNCISEIEGVLKKFGMLTVIHAPFVMNNLLSISEKFRKLSLDEVRLCIDSAQKLGSHSVTIHMGRTTAYSLKGEIFKKAMEESLREILDYSRTKNVEISIENLPVKKEFRQPYPRTESEMRELEKISKDVRFCIDTGHLVEGGLDLYGFLESFINRANCIHLHDATRDKDHLVIGKGEIDFERVFSILEKSGYDGPVLLENLDKEECMESYNKLKELGLV